MSQTTRPVTQTEVTEVNRAFTNGVQLPSAEDTGSIRMPAPSKITKAKPKTMI